MVDDFRLRHIQSLRHPVQEGEISSKIEINKFAHKVSAPSGAASSAIDVPFWEIDPVIERLDSENSKG